ncbi:DUF6011 domain-containing protein [Gordonia iterans]
MRTEESPGSETGALIKSIAADHLQRSEIAQAMDAETRRITALIAELADAGYRVAVDCARCGHPLTEARSVLLQIGPKCRRQAVANV